MSFALYCLLRFAAAEDVLILQGGQTFLRASAAARAEKIVANPSSAGDDVLRTLKIRVGDGVTFKNVDRVAHNVYGPGFDLLSQPPGSVARQKFDRPGKQTIRCAIHPKMKLEIEVEP